MLASPDMDSIVEISKRNSITLIEDAAQSLGAEYKGKKLGTFGDIGSFSFDAGKTLHVGEGGMVITNNKDLYDKVAEFSDHGHMHIEGLPRGKDPRRKPGLNYRMSELTAAVGLAQLKKIDYILDKAKINKYKLKDKINNIPEIEMRFFHDEDGAQGDTLIFSLSSTEKALSLEKDLLEKGYATKILPEAIDWHYGGSWSHIFKNKTSEELESEFKHTGELLRRSICLNIPVNMSDDSINEIARVIQLFCKQL